MSITGAQIAAPTPFPTLDLDSIDKQEIKARLAFERDQAAAKDLASSRSSSPRRRWPMRGSPWRRIWCTRPASA